MSPAWWGGRAGLEGDARGQRRGWRQRPPPGSEGPHRRLVSEATVFLIRAVGSWSQLGRRAGAGGALLWRWMEVSPRVGVRAVPAQHPCSILPALHRRLRCRTALGRLETITASTAQSALLRAVILISCLCFTLWNPKGGNLRRLSAKRSWQQVANKQNQTFSPKNVFLRPAVQFLAA